MTGVGVGSGRVRQMGGRRRVAYDVPRTGRATVALFTGAIVLLLMSCGLVVAMLRQGLAAPGQSPTPAGTAVAALATAAPPTADPTNTAPPPTATTATQGVPGPTATVPARTPTGTARPVATPVATQRPATVRAGGCALALPPAFREERPGGGYFPANDGTGFAALDAFDTNGGQRSASGLAQAFVEGTLKTALKDYRQIGASGSGDNSRVEYTARSGDRSGRGVLVVRRVGEVACGVSLFVLTDSAIDFDRTLEYLLSSLQPARP